MTELTPFSDELKNIFHCRLVHSRVPRATGKIRYCETLKENVPEIIWVCKEGCDINEVLDQNIKNRTI